MKRDVNTGVQKGQGTGVLMEEVFAGGRVAPEGGASNAGRGATGGEGTKVEMRLTKVLL